MYTPEHFRVSDQAALHRIIADHPLGVLVTSQTGSLDANHIPFEFEPAVGSSGLCARMWPAPTRFGSSASAAPMYW